MASMSTSTDAHNDTSAAAAASASAASVILDEHHHCPPDLPANYPTEQQASDVGHPSQSQSIPLYPQQQEEQRRQSNTTAIASPNHPPYTNTTTARGVAGRLPRAPNPAKKVTGKDELHSIINREAVEEQQQQQEAHLDDEKRRPSDLAASVIHMSGSAFKPAAAAARGDRGPLPAHRNLSIDSTISTISTASTSQRPHHAAALSQSYRDAQNNQGPEDAASLIAAAGSAEAAVEKILADKQHAASHNPQLWRLVEKQRAMILSLNKDLEKALKEKERYRRKLKEHIALSSAAPSLVTSSAGHAVDSDSRDTSQSPSTRMLGGSEVAASTRDMNSTDTRKNSETSDSVPQAGFRSDTPQDAANATSTQSAYASTTQATASSNPVMKTAQNRGAGSPPLQSRTVEAAAHVSKSGHRPAELSLTSQASPPPSATSFSSPKTRKAPPAPLNLQSARPEVNILNNIVDASDSEYEDDPESARSDFMERGRRKTREDDDREREVLAQQEDEEEEEKQRSMSKKDKKSHSRPVEKAAAASAAAAAAVPAVSHAHTADEEMPREPARQQPQIFSPTADPAALLRTRAVSDAQQAMQRKGSAPSGLLSPGLPMSPRPGDRPPNSPVPRAPLGAPASMPISPRAGTAGLPLSPRPPTRAIPMPPSTPMSLMSPHLDRAKQYSQTGPQGAMASIADRLKPKTNSPDRDRPRPSVSSDNSSEVYKGFVTEQYPDLLLPPNALPSIFVKTASSRMVRSRASLILPVKREDDNPVFTLAVYTRSDVKALWKTEKTFAALATLDQELKSFIQVHDRLPDKALFTGHAPAKVDARRLALNHYFETMLDAVTEERAARIICKFLSDDAFGSDANDYVNHENSVPDSPVTTMPLRPNMAGYLTKRGKNFGGWKARYFVLDGPNLRYFEGPGGAHLGSIKLQNSQIGKQQQPNKEIPPSNEDEDQQYRHAFLVLEPKKKDSNSLVRHVLCAESDEERDIWVDALLQYVDIRDEAEPQALARQAQVSKQDISSPRSPRMQTSMTDLRSGTSGSKDIGQTRSIEVVRAVGYNDTVQGEAPVMMGPPATPRVTTTPSPPHDKLTSGVEHPKISGPSNMHVISNAIDWGMKAPPTPGKDRKRSVFTIPFRGRSSSDLDGKDGALKSPGPHTHARGIFGVPLAEAVELSHLDGLNTELPSVVYRCIEYLTARNAIAEEGIFRLSGSSNLIKSLKERFNVEGDVNLLAENTYYDVHAVASLLKLYLRELPSTILTRELHIDFISAVELHGDERIQAINILVHKLPRANCALLNALSAFMLLIVNNVGVNKMNVRNLGVVFSPTLNLPGPLISLFVEEHYRIFGTQVEANDSPLSHHDVEAPAAQTQHAIDLRSPRRQMFSDLPTPAYNQTQFQSLGASHANDTGMIPMQPTYNYQMAPQGDGGYGSLNDALKSPTVYDMTGTGTVTPRDATKQRRSESGTNHMIGSIGGDTRKRSDGRLREEDGASF